MLALLLVVSSRFCLVLLCWFPVVVRCREFLCWVVLGRRFLFHGDCDFCLIGLQYPGVVPRNDVVVVCCSPLTIAFVVVFTMISFQSWWSLFLHFCCVAPPYSQWSCITFSAQKLIQTDRATAVWRWIALPSSSASLTNTRLLRAQPAWRPWSVSCMETFSGVFPVSPWYLSKWLRRKHIFVSLSVPLDYLSWWVNYLSAKLEAKYTFAAQRAIALAKSWV